MTALTLHFLLTADALGLWGVIAFCAVVTVAALLLDRAEQQDWRDLNDRTDQIRKGETNDYI